MRDNAKIIESIGGLKKDVKIKNTVAAKLISQYMRAAPNKPAL